MKERPIIFSGESVRAILDGRKTQTRRAVIPQPEYFAHDGVLAFADAHAHPAYKRKRGISNPYGEAGDRLWVRETWFCPRQLDDSHQREKLVYQEQHPNPPRNVVWSSPIHMPRWASRLTLEITDVRVQRVQEISETDCIAEGIEVSDIGKLYIGSGLATATIEYSKVWDSLNAKRGYSWESNPWVWAISFRVLAALLSGDAGAT